MKSVYKRILAWSFLTLVVSLFAFLFVTNQIVMRLGAWDAFPRLLSLELEDAREAYESGGQARLAAFIARLDRQMGARHFILDPRARELSSGVNRPDLLSRLNGKWDQPVAVPGGAMIASRTADGKYTLVVDAPVTFRPWTYLPYYGLILLAVALLCWMLALNIGSPLRSLARTVERFGQGDLSIRARSKRQDEIGELAGAFDRMADRIGTLLTAERRLLQDISHELRSPLARLGFAAELLRTAPDKEQAMARMRKEISRLSELIGALLQMTRAEGDPLSSNRRAFPLDQLVRDVAEDCSVEATARGCEIVCRTDADVSIIGDPELTRRAVENVLRNAVQYSPDGGRVDVSLEQNGRNACIAIRDQGNGVPEDHLDKIFQPFYRVDSSRNGETGGMGLGLAIATRAINLHHGSIEACNEKTGLLVTIRLPLPGDPISAKVAAER
jgi:two-component system sensor histidine kinase CpxA